MSFKVNLNPIYIENALKMYQPFAEMNEKIKCLYRRLTILIYYITTACILTHYAKVNNSNEVMSNPYIAYVIYKTTKDSF